MTEAQARQEEGSAHDALLAVGRLAMPLFEFQKHIC